MWSGVCLLFRASRECVPCFVKKMHGKEVHCTFFRANLRANVCAELGYEFYNDIYAEHVDIVSFKTPKLLGAAGVRAEVGGLCALSALYYTLTGRKSGICCVLSQFSLSFITLIHICLVCCRQESSQA